MARTSRRYPHDIVELDIPAEAMEAAKYETLRFLCNWFVWKGDLQLLCTICYLQGAFDGAQVSSANSEVAEAFRNLG